MQSAMKGKVQPIMLWEGKVPWKAKMPSEAKVPWTENAMNELSDLKVETVIEWVVTSRFWLQLSPTILNSSLGQNKDLALKQVRFKKSKIFTSDHFFYVKMGTI